MNLRHFAFHPWGYPRDCFSHKAERREDIVIGVYIKPDDCFSLLRARPLLYFFPRLSPPTEINPREKTTQILERASERESGGNEGSGAQEDRNELPKGEHGKSWIVMRNFEARERERVSGMPR